ncbi:oligosaccharide flippase family protein [Conexibacter sp. JD483]|uniref:lipopolysaccharide biosynthesis protein n=1 Tax=unclassified Conexibacter TaxID=2627773 RepID=UPI00271AE1B5|nr:MULTISPECIES: oligosaccharide flippase family protein [unclassified Conexibacter]MDO8184558.1 oligosaccharide flippase family protein [Conexibacter sp. CPCC 205706]MDO8197864.1 oligosaccharide flippase family protein [Conexibacter sp. CPCC 205762]MDR9370090.1 oligosaccharide flippase family protein [Conexibacter sp. JD483]
MSVSERAEGGGRGGRNGRLLLTAGIASTGALSFLYLALASRELSPTDYGHVSLLWSIAFVILSVIYRPIEQLLSRTIADRRARGIAQHSLRTPALIQAGFALIFLVVALILRTTIEDDLFGGNASLYWILVIAVLAYAGSYFARGWLAGHERFAGYGGLVLLESTSRFLFAVAAVAGITSGQTAIAVGIAVAPFVSMVVVPFAIRRMARGQAPVGAGGDAADALHDVAVLDAAGEGPAHAEIEEASADLSLRHGTGFAIAVFAIMLAEQTLMNAAVLIVEHTSGPELAGFVFNVLLIVRAPLQLFQAVQTSILPHLTALDARENTQAFARAIRTTVLAIAAFAGTCAIALAAIGPWAMELLLGDKGFSYERGGLVLVALGMGFHLVAGTLNQAALARRRAPLAAVAWLLSAALFVAWVASPVVSDEVMRVETGYFGAALILSCLLFGLYRRPAD